MTRRHLPMACAIVATMLTMAVAADPPPMQVPRTAQFDFTSKVNGEAYRVVVGTPPNYERTKAFPVLYVLESNVYFATAFDALTRQIVFKNAAPAIVVGIGYPSDEIEVGLTRRWYDLTPTHDSKEKRRNGGGDTFLKIIEEEIKPMVAERYRIDLANQAIWGHSNGGLMVMRAMMRNPASYATFLISSPNIGWDDSAVLKDEPAFAKWLADGGSIVKVLLSYGSDDYKGIIQRSAELNARMAALSASRLKLHHQVFEGETHITVSHVSLTRALRFAFPPPP